jgi:hypothetical protein
VGYVPGNPKLRHTVQVLPVRLIGARSLTAPNTTVAVQCTSPLIERDVYTLSESRKRRVHSAGERVVLDALACIGTAVALFSVVKRQHEGSSLAVDSLYLSQNRRRLKSLDDEVDTERQLPEGLRNRRDALHQGPELDDVEHDGD